MVAPQPAASIWPSAPRNAAHSAAGRRAAPNLPRKARHEAGSSLPRRRHRTRPAGYERRDRSRAPAPAFARRRCGAPGDILEHAAVRGFETEQIIAAVGRRAEHGAIARPRQHCGGFDQERGRQSRTVGIEHDGRTVAARQNFAGWYERDSRRNAAAKHRSGRSPPARCPGRNLPIPAARRRRNRRCRAPRRGVASGQDDVIGDVLQESGVQRRGLIETSEAAPAGSWCVRGRRPWP